MCELVQATLLSSQSNWLLITTQEYSFGGFSDRHLVGFLTDDGEQWICGDATIPRACSGAEAPSLRHR